MNHYPLFSVSLGRFYLMEIIDHDLKSFPGANRWPVAMVTGKHVAQVMLYIIGEIAAARLGFLDQSNALYLMLQAGSDFLQARHTLFHLPN